MDNVIDFSGQLINRALQHVKVGQRARQDVLRRAPCSKFPRPRPMFPPSEGGILILICILTKILYYKKVLYYTKYRTENYELCHLCDVLQKRFVLYKIQSEKKYYANRVKIQKKSFPTKNISLRAIFFIFSLGSRIYLFFFLSEI